MCVANDTDMCRLADCDNQASVSNGKESSDDEVEDVDYENYDYWVMNVRIMYANWLKQFKIICDSIHLSALTTKMWPTGYRDVFMTPCNWVLHAMGGFKALKWF